LLPRRAYRHGREQSGYGGRGPGAAQGAQDIEQFPSEVVGFERRIDVAVHQAGEALEAAEHSQGGGIKVGTRPAPLS